MKYQHQRKAFSMVTAIVVIVLMATVAMLVMSMSGKMVKETTAQYQEEQAALLAKSYTEYAVMAVTANDRSIPVHGNACLTTINGTMGDAVVGAGGAAGNPNNGYLINVNISYIGTAAALGLCAAPIALDDTVHAASNTPLTIIVDVYVQYRDLDNPAGPNMTYHRRTVQKI